MGQNSQDLSYAFGQMGSSYHNIAGQPLYPPQGLVIVAIQFLAANTLSELHTETLDTAGPQYITTEDVEATDNNYLGVTEAACDGNRTTVNFDNDTVIVADAAANLKIKPGQYVLLVADDDAIGDGITPDTSAGHVDPIYNGPNAQGVRVVSVAGGTYGTHITLDTALNPDANNTMMFLDSYHGAGGSSTDGATYPTGMVIYGRWTKVELGSTDTDGGIICYFGY